MYTLEELQRHQYRPLRFLMTLSLILVAIFPIGLYYRTIIYHAINIPFEDDYDSGIAFISNYMFHTSSVGIKINQLFVPHNEHRIIFNRLVFLLDYGLEKQLNFRHIILFGNLSLILILILIGSYLVGKRLLINKLLVFLPIPFLLFQFHFWELMIWAMGSVQNLYVIFFASLSLYFLAYSRQKPNYFWLSIFGAVVATFTSGNGMFVFIVGLLLLLALRAFGLLAIWFTIAIVVIMLYFWHYNTFGHHPLPKTTLIFAYFFTLIGSVFSTHSDLAIWAGFSVFVLFISLLGWLTYTRRIYNHLFPIGFICFIYLTCISLSLTRSSLGLKQAMTSRYGILPVMLLISLYILVVTSVTSRVRQLAIASLGLLIGLYLNWHSYWQNMPKIRERSGYYRESCRLYHVNKEYVVLFRANPDARPIFYDGIQKGIYQVPLLHN